MKNSSNSNSLAQSLYRHIAIFGVFLTLLSTVEKSAASGPRCDSGYVWADVGTQYVPSPYTLSLYASAPSPITFCNGKLYVLAPTGSSGPFGLLSLDPVKLRWSVVASSLLGSPAAGLGSYVLTSAGTNLYLAGPFNGFTNGGVGGSFVPATNVAVYNGRSWTPIGNGTPTTSDGSYCPIQSMAVDSLGNIYLGLEQTAPIVQSPYVGMLVEWNPGSQLWQPVGGGLEPPVGGMPCGPVPHIALPWGVTALAANGTDLYVGGEFIACGNGSTSYFLAKWSSANNAWTGFVPSPWAYWDIYDGLTIDSLLLYNNVLWVAGNISPICYPQGTFPLGLAQFGPNLGNLLTSNANGNLWTGCPSSCNQATGAALGTLNCELYLAGDFQSIGGWPGGNNTISGFAESNNNGGSWASLGSGLVLNGYPGIGSYICVDTNNAVVYVSGEFNTAGGVSVPGLAKWYSPSGPPPPPPQ